VWLGSDNAKGFGLEFSEGTKVDFGSGALARVIHLTPQGGVLELKQGHAALEVVPLPGARWSLRAGPFTIVVTGTKFDVVWDAEADSLEVVMHEGQVMLVGCGFGEGRSLTVGQTARARCKDSSIAVGYGQHVEFGSVSEAGSGSSPPGARADETSSAQAGVAPSEPAAPTGQVAGPNHPTAEGVSGGDGHAEPRPSTSASASPALDWRALAQAGSYAQARQAVEAAGFESTLAQLGPSDLMLLGEALRHAGALDKSAQTFVTLRRRFGGSNEASMAAFALGRLHFDARRAYGNAARWFSAYLKESPNGAFAREALGRLMEANFKGRNVAESERLARRYLKLYPAGPHAELATRIRGRN
jgi:TolA-binding protein